jgi:hypothetical protein
MPHTGDADLRQPGRQIALSCACLPCVHTVVPCSPARSRRDAWRSSGSRPIAFGFAEGPMFLNSEEVIRDTVPYSYRYSCAYTVHRNLIPHCSGRVPSTLNRPALRSRGLCCSYARHGARAAYVVPALHTLAARARRLESIGDKKGRGAGERGRLEEREWHLERGAHLMRETIKASYVRS